MVLFFYTFASLIICSSIMTVISRHSVHAVLWLIFTFCNVAGLMILMGAEYFGMIVVIIYVGAIAILFLFVVMMLNLNLSELCYKVNIKDFLIPIVIAFLLCSNFIAVILFGISSLTPGVSNMFKIIPEVHNVNLIGALLYTDFILPFQMAGIILFIAMIGTIVLTMKIRRDNKRQNVRIQMSRTKESGLSIQSVQQGAGVDNIDYDN